MYSIALATLCFHTALYCGGFSGETTLKIIKKYRKNFNIAQSEIRKTTSVEDLWRYQKKIVIPLWSMAHRSPWSKETEGPKLEEVIIEKHHENPVVGINFLDRKRMHALDFDIVCSKYQSLSTSYGVICPYAKDLSKRDSLICIRGSQIIQKKITEISLIYNEENTLYRIVPSNYGMVLLGRHGAMASIKPITY